MKKFSNNLLPEMIAEEVDGANVVNNPVYSKIPKYRNVVESINVLKNLPEIYDLLQEITEGKGRFSLDPLEHADNCIADMKGLAEKALALMECECVYDVIEQ